MKMSYMRKNLEEIKFDVWYFRVPFDYARIFRYIYEDLFTKDI